VFRPGWLWRPAKPPITWRFGFPAKVLIPGDNWYHAFPNLYAIRSTPYRDFAAWTNSLGALAEMGGRV